jgi:hypothetical protein
MSLILFIITVRVPSDSDQIYQRGKLESIETRRRTGARSMKDFLPARFDAMFRSLVLSDADAENIKGKINKILPKTSITKTIVMYVCHKMQCFEKEDFLF